MIRLHHCHQTRSMRVLWLLHEIGCPFEVEIHAFDNTLAAPGYLEKHPVGRVPALELDGVALWESGAIIEVLCEQFPESGLGRATGSAERADWLTWLHFAESVSQHSAALTQQHVMLFKDWMRSPTVTKLEARRLARCFAAIDRRLEVSGDYLLPGGFSAVDVAAGQAVYMGRHFARLDPFPALQAWYDRITARPAFKAAIPPEGAALLYDRDFYPEIPADPSRDRIARVRTYFERLTASDIPGIVDLFEDDAVVNSPFLGTLPVAEFFRTLGDASAESRLTVFDVLVGENAASAAAHFEYDWTLRSGDRILFQGIDHFTFGESGGFASLSIFYDTHPVRADVGDKYAVSAT